MDFNRENERSTYKSTQVYLGVGNVANYAQLKKSVRFVWMLQHRNRIFQIGSYGDPSTHKMNVKEILFPNSWATQKMIKQHHKMVLGTVGRFIMNASKWESSDLIYSLRSNSGGA